MEQPFSAAEAAGGHEHQAVGGEEDALQAGTPL